MIDNYSSHIITAQLSSLTSKNSVSDNLEIYLTEDGLICNGCKDGYFGGYDTTDEELDGDVTDAEIAYLSDRPYAGNWQDRAIAKDNDEYPHCICCGITFISDDFLNHAAQLAKEFYYKKDKITLPLELVERCSWCKEYKEPALAILASKYADDQSKTYLCPDCIEEKYNNPYVDWDSAGNTNLFEIEQMVRCHLHWRIQFLKAEALKLNATLNIITEISKLLEYIKYSDTLDNFRDRDLMKIFSSDENWLTFFKTYLESKSDK